MNSQEFMKSNTKRIDEVNKQVKQQGDVDRIHLLISNISRFDVCRYLGYHPELPNENSSVYFFISDGETSMKTFLIILIKRMFSKPQTTVGSSPFAGYSYGNDESIMKFIIGNGCLFLDIKMQQNAFRYVHDIDVFKQFMAQFEHILLNTIYKLNPAFQQSKLPNLMAFISRHLDQLKKKPLHQVMNSTGQEMLRFMKHVLPRLELRDSLAWIFELLFGEKTHESFVIFDHYQKIWCSIFAWEVMKILFVEVLETSVSKNIQTVINLQVENQFNSVAMTVNDKREEIDSLNLIFNIEHSNEIVAALHDVDIKCATQHEIAFQVIECELPAIHGSLCVIENGILKIRNGGDLFVPPFQTIQVSMINSLIAKEVKPNESITNLLRKMLALNIIDSCRTIEDLLILMSFADQLVFRINDDTAIDELMVSLRAILEFHKVVIEGVELIDKMNAQKIILNSFIKFVHQKLTTGDLFIQLEVKWKGCKIMGSIAKWHEDIAKEMYGCDSQSLSISRDGSSLVTYISINSLKRQLSKCACIGSNQTGLKKHGRVDLQPCNHVLSKDERAVKIKLAYENWNEIHKHFKFDVNPATMNVFSKYGSVLVDGNSMVPNFVFVAKSFEATQLIEEFAKCPIDRFNIQCTFNFNEGFKFINFSENEMECVMKKEKGIFYDKLTNLAVILSVKVDEDLDNQESNFFHLSRMRFSQSMNTKVTNEKIIECLGETYHVSFMYNEDLSEMQCFIPKSCVSYVYTTRNGAEYFKVIKKGGEVKYQQIQVVVTKIADELLYFHNGKKIDCYQMHGDLVKVSWIKELNKLNSSPAINKLTHELNKLVGSIKLGSLVELGAPSGILKASQVIPIIINLKQMNLNSINKQYSDTCISSFKPKVETTNKVQLFCDDSGSIICKDGKFVYILCSDKPVISNGVVIEQKEVIEKVINTVRSYRPIERHLSKIEGLELKLLYKQQMSMMRFDVTFIKTNELSIGDWYTPILNLEELNKDYPLINLGFNNLAIGKIWTASDLVEIKKSKDINWDIKSGKLVIPNELKLKFPDLDVVDLCKSTDWFNKLHSLVEKCIQQSLLSKGHSCEIEFTTSSGNERDILVDKEIIIEIKTQTLYNRAMQSFLENGKHIGEYLIAATRHSLFASKFIVEKYYDSDAQDLQFICDVVCGYNKLRDENGKIMKNLFERMNFPQSVSNTNEINTVVVHDDIRNINKGEEPKYHAELKERFLHSKFDKLFDSLNSGDDCPFIKMLTHKEKFDEFNQLRQRFDDLNNKKREIENELQQLDGKIAFFTERFNETDNLDEFMLSSEEQAVFDEVAQEIGEKSEALSEIEVMFYDAQTKLNEFVENEFDDLIPSNETQLDGVPFKFDIETNVVSHDNLGQQINDHAVQYSPEDINTFGMLTKFNVEHNFMKLSYDLTQIDGKFMRTKQPLTPASNKEVEFESDKFKLQLRISGSSKRLTILRKSSNRTCVADNVAFKAGLFSDPDQLSCMDVIVIMILMCIVDNKPGLVKPSWGGLMSINCFSITKSELSECINYIWRHFKEFKLEFMQMNVSFIRAPDVFGVQLSMSNVEHEIRSGIDDLINTAINKWEIRHWKNQRLNYVKLVTQLLFLNEFESNLRSSEFDNAYKIVKHVISRFNSGAGTKLPEDACFVQTRCIETDQPLMTQNLIQKSLNQFAPISVDDLNQFNESLCFEVSTFNVKFDFE